MVKFQFPGAMILSKLDDTEQVKFHKDNKGQCNVAMIRRFVSNSFMELDRADWIKDNADIWDNGTFKPCAECEFSTANHGCLFYEMNSEKANCTNPVCYKKKQIAYVLRRIQAESENLVKHGEPMAFGKTVIIDNGPETYWGEEKQAQYNNTMEAVRQLGYCIVTPNEVFKSKCWYNEEDERIKRCWIDSEIYRAYLALIIVGQSLMFCITILEKILLPAHQLLQILKILRGRKLIPN